jgi:ATP-dependent helicase HrpA
MTDGILLAEIRSDPDLRGYEAIILDEAHERSLNIDFLLGYIKELLVSRSDLKVVITSATIDTELFSKAFNDAPIFQVSGRLFPVDIQYRPLSSFDDEEEVSHVRGASEAVRDIIVDSYDGDILVFMPTERDIRETCDLIRDKSGKSVEVFPLMGSLSNAEQEKVFASSSKRKVIVSTNIAETSLTIPGIRFVIDSGLARVSRYSARQRIRRLPVERIAQSNANQRSGRAGRVEAGVCIRLYERDDFDSRAPFAEPEILRANLAEVILRMKAFKLGDIATFPFLNPPEPRAIKGGFALLHELGALDANGEVSRVGMELAKLPVDPTIGRMLLQARRERCLAETVIIAAALSLQDPRERPVEAREKADQAHRAFLQPDSDFLSFLKLWTECAKALGDARSKSALRKFCKANYLSFARMREWGDLINELAREMGADLSAIADPATIARFDGRYRAIHRSILSGFLGQVGYRLGPNSYRAGAGRELSMWPGSSLAERNRPASQKTRQEPRRRSAQQQAWIVSSEIVETSKVFARNNARVVVSWIEEIAQHLIKRSYVEPRWCAERRAVIADERVTLYGLLLSTRRVLYGRYNPEEAREIFIQNALLVTEESSGEDWISNNRALANKVAVVLSSQGRLNRVELEERFAQFYRERLPLISSIEELERFLRDRRKDELRHLDVSFAYLTRDADFSNIEEQFPDSISLAGEDIRVWYAYEPGTEIDGVTLELPRSLAKGVTPELLEGVIPGLRERQVLHLLHELPKELRKQIGGLPSAAQRIAQHETMKKLPLMKAVQAILREEFSTHVPDGALALSSLPAHLRPRVALRNDDQVDQDTAPREGRGVAPTQKGGDYTSSDEGPWAATRGSWEREDLSSWDFGDLPENIQVGVLAGVPILLYPTLRCEGDRIAIRLVDSREGAGREALQGRKALATRVLSKEVGDLKKQARDIERLRPLALFWCTPDDLKNNILEGALNYIFDHPMTYPLTKSSFDELLTNARERIPNVIPTLLEATGLILELRKNLLNVKRPYTGMKQELDALVPADVHRVTPFHQLRQLPRYLRAMTLRCERMDTNPARYEQCVRQLRVYTDRLPKLPADKQTELRWMIEELKVSFFAQELGTQYPISPKRIDAWLAQKQS